MCNEKLTKLFHRNNECFCVTINVKQYISISENVIHICHIGTYSMWAVWTQVWKHICTYKYTSNTGNAFARVNVTDNWAVVCVTVSCWFVKAHILSSLCRKLRLHFL